ncbi:MAG TPA: C4-dicarboxylate transporter DctA [Pirellulales bacterium]|nr:C4-dicarboxylate transporter DctA [Pirellulales bacterium]
MPAPVYKNLTFQVLVAIVIGLSIGYFRPEWGQALQPLGDGFIRLVKMVVGPIIFLTIVCGIASMGGIRKVGRVGAKALLYFELITTLALVIGLLVANIAQPGTRAGRGIALGTADESRALAMENEPVKNDTQALETSAHGAGPAAKEAQHGEKTPSHSVVDSLLNTVPVSIVGAFADGNLLQILFFAILFGVAISSLGRRQSHLIAGLEHVKEVMFRMVTIIMKVAPLGALGAMAYTVGKFGIVSLVPLAKLMACVYLTMALFIFVVLAIVCRMFGFSLWRYLRFIQAEIVLVLGTSSSESALPRMIEKMELMGCGRGIVGLVIPTGYSFNLDGTSIYLSMAVLFISQAYGIHLSASQQLYLMLVLMLTSKGAAAVTGGGFVTLAATLEATHLLPIEGLALLLGVDRFMSEARAITNLIGNGVATVVISKLEGEFDQARYDRAVAGETSPLATSENSTNP